MPSLMSRDAAVALAEREAAPCVACALVERRVPGALVLAESAHGSLIFPRLGVRWAHLLVVLGEHTTSFTDLDREAWLDACALAHRAARALERVLRPSRVFVASLGAPEPAPAMSTPHVHLHVLPLARSERPSEVLTWKNGVVVGSDREREELAARLVNALVASA